MPPECLADFTRFGPFHDTLDKIAILAGADLKIHESINTIPCESAEWSSSWPRPGREGLPGGFVACGPDLPLPLAASAGQAVWNALEHAFNRETAITDFADQLCVCYEELNLIYSLVQTMATKVDEEAIGAALVAQASETLDCRRVSLLVLDDRQTCLRVLASRGIPEEARNAVISITDSIAGRALQQEGDFFIEDICKRPDLAELSQGSYETSVFAVIRVPLRARGQPLGVLTATERNDCGEFTSRDAKLLESLSAMGAASLLNSRLQRAIQEQMISTIRALAHAVDVKDHYTRSHSGRVSQLCVATARRMGITDSAPLRRIELAGLLHDIGKIAVPDAILGKTTRLTPEEYGTFIITHVRIGAEIVGKVQGLEDVATAILHHHERYDGQGYPDGLRGNDIPLVSRLVAVADCYDAMVSDRPYRKALSLQEALVELRRCSGAQCDPDVVDALTTVVQAPAWSAESNTSPTGELTLAT